MGLWRIPRSVREAEEREQRKREEAEERAKLRPRISVIVCGDSTDREFVFAALDHLRSVRRLRDLRVSDEPGAARLAMEWAMQRSVDCYEYPTEWEWFGESARSLRNGELMRAGPNGVVVFGEHAEDLIELAAAAGIEVWRPRTHSG